MLNNSAAKVNNLKQAVIAGTPQEPIDYKLTAEKIKKLLPRGSSHQVTDKVMDAIHKMEDDTGLEQNYLEEQLLSHINIMKDLKVDMIDYVNAVKYCTLKQNMTNRMAWEIVFPDRLARAEAKKKQREAEGRGASVNIDSHVSNYNTTQVVVQIDTQLAVAWNVLYMPARAQALRNLINLGQGIAKPSADGELMTVTPHVQFLANKEVVDVLKPPEESHISLKLEESETQKTFQQNLISSLDSIVASQRAQLEAGKDIRVAGRLKLKETEGIIDAELD